MNILRGNLPIIKYKELNISVNFNDLFKERGGYIYKIKLEREIAAMMDVFALILLVLPIILLILNGTFSIQTLLLPKTFIGCIAYFSIIPYLYSRYLTRNRDEFNTTLKQYDLRRKIKKIAIDENKIIILNDYFTTSLKTILDSAYFRQKNNFIYNCFDILKNFSSISYLLKERLGVDLLVLEKKIQNKNITNDLNLNNIYREFFTNLFHEAQLLNFSKIDENILFFVLNKYYLVDEYRDLNISELELEGIKIWYKNEHEKKEYYNLWKRLSLLKPTGDINRAYTSKATPLLDIYSDDFTRKAVKGNFITSIAKDKEMADLLEILERDNNSAILILGDPGVGKTRFIHYLATKMALEDVPPLLKDLRLLVIDLNKIFTESSNIDKFKENLSKIFFEAYKSGNIILVLEELAQTLNIRADYRSEVINLIINALDSLKIKMIATSSYINYTKYIQPVQSLASQFEVINLKEPPSNISIQILIDEVPILEKRYKLKVHIDALKRIVDYSSKFDFDRVMPDKGIDILDEACVIANSNGLNYVDKKIVDELLSRKIGIKVGDISSTEGQMLNNLETEMHKRIIGQSEAVTAIINAIKRSRAGLTSNKKPIASFLFFGPTGVGKTEIAKTLADLYYGGEQFMIRLDMSEYQEENNLQRLIGYSDTEGNFVGGELVQAVRNKPFSLVLLDEVDKANKKVLDLFLQVLDDGYLTDGLNRRIDFTNTIIIMTSNVGSQNIANLIMQGKKYYDVEKEVITDLRAFFRIEFLNRFDKLIMFTPLRVIEVKQIIELLLMHLKEKLLEKGIDILWNERTVEMLLKIGYNPINGARELKRITQENLENKIAKLIIDQKLKSGQEVVLDGLTPVKVLD